MMWRHLRLSFPGGSEPIATKGAMKEAMRRTIWGRELMVPRKVQNKMLTRAIRQGRKDMLREMGRHDRWFRAMSRCGGIWADWSARCINDRLPEPCTRLGLSRFMLCNHCNYGSDKSKWPAGAGEDIECDPLLQIADLVLYHGMPTRVFVGSKYVTRAG